MQMTINSYNNEIDRIKGVVAHWAESLSSSPSTSSSSSSPLSSWSRSGLVPHMAVSLPLAPLPSPTPWKSPAGCPATLSFPVLCGEAYILHMRHISHIYACFQVQTHCPFNIIEDEPSMASGDPTFLCRGQLQLFVILFIYKKIYLQNSFPFFPFQKYFFAKFISFLSFSKRFRCKIHFLTLLTFVLKNAKCVSVQRAPSWSQLRESCAS